MTKVTRLTLGEDGGLQNRRIHLREISGDIDAPLETVGQDLRAARLRRGDDLATVSRALKIRKDHLEALEEDRLDALPGRTYAIGFVRSYADYLGLDAVQSVERFKAEIAGRSDHSTPPVQVIDEDEHRRLPQGWKIIAGVVVVLLFYGAWKLIASADQMLSQPVTPPPPQPTSKPTTIARIAKPPHSAVHAVPAMNAASINAAGSNAAGGTANPATPAGQTPAPGAAPGTQASIPSNALMPSGDNAPGPQQQLAALPQGEVFGGQNHNARVVLRVHTTTKILVQGPGGMVFINRTLKPGDTYQVPNLVGLTLTTTDAGAVELDLDGASMGFAGHNQEMKEAVSLDPQAIVDRYNGGRG